MTNVERARQVMDIEIDAMCSARDSLGAGFEQAVALLLDCLGAGGKIVVTGVGKSLHVGMKLSATLASTGSTSVVLDPTQAMHGDLGILNADDVLLALSYSGESEEVHRLIPQVKRMGLRIVALTGTSTGTLARLSDVVVEVSVEREACPFNMAPTASTTATLAVGDALAIVLLEARGFAVEDYARLHPGGSIGRALLTRVSDIMRTGDRVASVEAGARVRDALLAMTAARAGSVAVLDAVGIVVGIFTDGDLRRHMSRGEDMLDRSIDDVMTPSPIVVREDRLAVDVLRIYESHAIDDLVVVDSEGRLLGAIDIQDLPKLKIM